MKTLQLLLIGMLSFAAPAIAQVAINTSGEIAAASAILDISSSSKGVLIPRLSTNERTTIDSPANGLMVYDTDTDSFWYYYLPYLSWTEIVTTASNNLDGLTDGKSYGSSDFLGTSAGRSSTGSNCTGIGHAALYANTTGSSNIAYGSFSLFENTIGSYNLAAGISSLRENISGSSNIAIGGSSLFSNTSGSFNIAIGSASNYFNQTGSSNTIIGYRAGRGTSLHNKSGNIFLGYQAGYNETGDNKLYIENSNSDTPLIGGDFDSDEVYINGTLKITGGTPGVNKILTSDEDGNATWEYNAAAADINGLSDGINDGSSIFMGNDAGINDDASQNQNTAVGNNALETNTTGSYNSAYGYRTMRYNTTGYSNSAYGSSALVSNTVGNQNTAIGNLSLYYNTTGNANTATGYGSLNKNITGDQNCTAGAYSSYNNTSGNANIILGYQSDYYNDGGSSNTIIGYQAGRTTSTHSKSGNIFLGYQAGYNETGDNKLYIENSNSDTPLIGGDFDDDEVYINGTIKITGGTPGADKVLTSDEDGNATWEASQVGVTEINDLSDGKSDGSSVFIGTNAGLNDDGSNNRNTATGIEALKANITGANNTAVGYNALIRNTTGHQNTAIGVDALRRNTTGSYNVGLGYGANNYNSEGSYNTAVGFEAGRGGTYQNSSGNIFLGYKAGYSETGSNKLYIENSNSSAPLIGGDFDDDEVYFNTDRVGIGTSIPREILEVASRTNSYGRMIVSDGGGDERNVILFVSPTASNQTARIEAYKYGTGVGGLTLNFNTVGNGNSIFGGHVLPEHHTTKNLGGDGQAWNNVYAHNYVTQGSAAFADVKVTQQLIDFPPKEKQTGAFDEFTEKGLKELDPTSLPDALKENNAILIDEMTTYNYKANYEQQLQIEELKNNKDQQKQIDFLTIENNNLKNRLEKLERLINAKHNSN